MRGMLATPLEALMQRPISSEWSASANTEQKASGIYTPLTHPTAAFVIIDTMYAAAGWESSSLSATHASMCTQAAAHGKNTHVHAHAGMLVGICAHTHAHGLRTSANTSCTVAVLAHVLPPG